MSASVDRLRAVIIGCGKIAGLIEFDPGIKKAYRVATHAAAFSGSGASVDSNVWVFAKIGGTWYAATWEWLRAGTTCKELGASDFKTHVNDVAPLNSWTPKSGEQIGLMVSTPARLGPDGPVNERSNVVLRTWP